MTAPTVADEVDDDVLFECLSELEGKLCHTNHGLWVIAVHVEDWNLDSLRDVGRVGHRTCLAWRGGEANLVVDHDVDGSANLVAAKLRHVENLEDDSLTGEG